MKKTQEKYEDESENKGCKGINILWVSLFIAVTFGVFGPLCLFLTNIDEFWFSIGDVWWIALLGGLLLFGACYWIGQIFRREGKEVYACLIFGLTLGLYIQGNWIFTDYGLLDGVSIDWTSYTNTAITNTILWLLCIALPFCLRYLIPRFWRNIVKYASIFLVLIQVITLGTLLLTTNLSQHKSDTYLSIEGEFSLSQDRNIVLFVLDAFDSSYFKELMIKYPELTEIFTNFIYYPDTVGGATRTSAAIPVILTGQAWIDSVSYADYLVNSYSETKLYEILKEYNYDIGIYTKSSFVPSSQKDRVINLTNGLGVVSSYRLLSKYLYQFTAFRYMPHLLKSKFWFYSGVFEDIHSGSNAKSYVVDDSDFYQRLLEEKITANSGGNAFRVYHLLGAHPPFTVNEYMEEVPTGETTQLKQARGSLYIIEEYIRQLKKMGIYDNTALFIMADHGNVNDEQNPILMIKPFNERSGFQISNAPLSYFDLHSTLISLITEGNKSYGKTFFDFKEGDERTRLFYRLLSDDGITVNEYKVNGHAWDKKTIFLTGNIYKGDSQLYTYKYKLGTPLVFGSTGNASQYLISGFSSGSAGGHTWTNDKSAQMKFILKDKPKSDLVVSMKAQVNNCVNSQRMIVSVNDTIVSEWSYTDSLAIDFAIPLELIDSQTLIINFEFPDAVSPASLFGEGYDARTLAFAFTNFTISEGIPKDPNIINSYSLGDAIEFTENNDGTRYFMYGIGKINTNHAWSVGKASGLILKVNDSSKDLNCAIDFSSVVSNRQHLIITSNGVTLFDSIVTSSNKSICFKIPAECIKAQTLSLTMEYPDAASPKDLGTGEDRRVLAVAFRRVLFEEDKG